MKRAAKYQTRQLAAVFDYVKSRKDAHVTAAQVVAHFSHSDMGIGRTTVYRSLDKLTESGKIRRYITDGISGACYQYVEDADCHSHFHMKCENCGELRHFECNEINGLTRHLSDSHAFRVDMGRTVFYGTCNTCYINLEGLHV